MKEWQELLKYIDYYFYDDVKEKIVIIHDSESDNALKAYKKGLRVLREKNPFKKSCEFYFEYYAYDKWEYDIALDCVRRMNQQDRETALNNMVADDYHFGYAMGIRNRYIRCARKLDNFDADAISYNVMKKIFSILSPIYDYRNEIITGFYENTSNLRKLYYDSQADLFDGFENRLADSGRYKSDEEAVNDFKNLLRVRLGKDEFIGIFKETLEDYNARGDENDDDERYWAKDFPSGKAMLYPLETKQMNVLRKMGLFDSVENYKIKSPDACRKFIDENLGLRDDYADYMARTAWEACNPFSSDKWKELSICRLDLDCSSKWSLENKGIKNLGDLTACSFEQIADIDGIGLKVARKIKEELESLGLAFGNGDFAFKGEE